MDERQHDTPRAGRPAPPLIGLPLAALHLLGLGAFAIAWRFLQPLSLAPEFFIERSIRGLDLVLYVLVLLLLVPAVLLLIEWLAGLVGTALRAWLHLAFVAGFAGLVAWQEITQRDDLGAVTWVLALAVAVAVAALYARSEPVRSFFSFVGVAPLVVLLAFFAFSANGRLAFGGKGPGPIEASAAQTPVVWLLLDELPVVSLLDAEGKIDADRYPNIARLAATSTWYRNMTSVADETQLAVPALVSGTRSVRSKLPITTDYPNTLFRLLGGTYRMDVVEFATHLCDRPVCQVQVEPPVGRRMRTLFVDTLHRINALPPAVRDPIADALAAPPWKPPPPPARPVSVRHKVRGAGLKEGYAAFARTLRPSTGRTLNYFHSVHPHRPWDTLDSGQTYPSARPYTSVVYGPWPEDPKVSAIAYQRHLLQLGGLDRALGRLLDRLEEIDLFDRAMVVLVADHGAAFQAGEESRRVTRGNIEEVAAVPLIVKTPGQRTGRVDDAPVDSTDLVPTIAEELGIDVPWRVDGKPAGTVGAGERATVTTLSKTGGGKISIAREELQQRIRAALARKLALFGDGDEGPGLFALGGHAELLGKRADSIPAEPAGALKATLDGPDRYRAVEPDGPSVPAEVTGTIRGGEGGGRRIAIAVNGRIAATAQTLGSGAGELYSAIVPPGSLRAGANSVAVYAIVGPDGRERLQPLL